MTSDIWFTLVPIWSVAGFALLTFVDAVAKSEGDDGIFFHWQNGEDAFVAIFMSLFLFLLWPLFIILMAVLALRPDLAPEMKAPLVRAPQGAPRRRIHLPRLDTPFWKPPEHEAEVVSRMIRLRLKKDRRLAGEPPPWRWPMERIWASTEAHIMELARGYLALREDGLAPAEIVARLEAERDGAANPPDARLRPYLKWRIAQADPDYAALGRRVFSPALAMAIRWARRAPGGETTPSTAWLCEDLISAEVDAAFEGLFAPGAPLPENWRDALAAKRREWAVLKLRIRDGDRLCRYEGGPDGAASDHAGRGIALLRKDTIIGWTAAISAAAVDSEDHS